jgi:hypothetical protein
VLRKYEEQAMPYAVMIIDESMVTRLILQIALHRRVRPGDVAQEVAAAAGTRFIVEEVLDLVRTYLAPEQEAAGAYARPLARR